MAVSPALYDELLPLLINPRKEGDVVLSYCPVHNDGEKHGRQQSGRGGRSLQLHPTKGLRCASHSCDFKAILDALRARGGPKERTTAHQPSQGQRSGMPPGTSLKVAHEYRDSITGDLVAVHGRWEWPDESKPKGYDKTHRWRLPNGTYEQGLGGMPMADMPLFHGELLAVADPERRVWWVEGEECVLALEAAGEIAVCGGGGSGGNTFRKGQLDALIDRDVIIWADNDEPGRKHATAMRDTLREIARRVVVWEPKGTNERDDAVDFLRAGRSLDEFAWPKGDALGEYEVGVDKSITAIRPVGIFQLQFRAVGIRKERTGVHATVTIRTRAQVLAFSNFNVERDEDRVRLTNSAHKQLPEPLAQTYPNADLKRDLDAFCAGLWDALGSGYDLGELSGDYDASGPPLVMERFVIEGGGTILFGAPGKGKSTIGLLMAQSINSGSSYLWQVHRPQPVLYINLERSTESMRARLARANRVLGLEDAQRLHFLNARGKTLSEVADAVGRYCRKHSIELAVLDSISRAGNGKLTEDDVGNKTIDLLNALFKTWIAIGHTSREDDTHIFGTQMWDAGADVCVQLVSATRADGRMGVGLQITKANDVPKGRQEIWALEHDEGGLVGIQRGKEGEFVEVEDKAERPTDERIAIALRSGSLTIQDIADRAGLGFEAVKKSLYRHPDKFVIVVKAAKGQAAQWGLKAEEEEFACSSCGAPARAYSDKGQPVCERCEERTAVG